MTRGSLFDVGKRLKNRTPADAVRQAGESFIYRWEGLITTPARFCFGIFAPAVSNFEEGFQ
jgi:hypothetical protein